MGGAAVTRADPIVDLVKCFAFVRAEIFLRKGLAKES
jgi:hypothetical protein